MTLTKLFGDSLQTRITEVFVGNPDHVLSLREIMEMSEVSFGEMTYNHINTLIDIGIVNLYGMDGNIPIYKLNCDNSTVKILVMLDRSIVSEELGKMIISYDNARKVIVEYIKNVGGRKVYISELSEELLIDFDLIEEIIDEMK